MRTKFIHGIVIYMARTSSRGIFAELLRPAGIELNGPHPWDPQILDESLYDDMLAHPSLGLGEGYMHEKWKVADLAGFASRAIRAANLAAFYRPTAGVILHVLKTKLFNLQKGARAFQVGQEHYDIGNDLYEAMLDPRMIYTCAYRGRGATTLAQAQEDKLRLVGEKLGLKAGDRVLDIGCGWGGSLIYMAQNFGITGVGLTISVEQAKLAEAKIAAAGLSEKLTIKVIDYAVYQDEPFDHIYSLGMFEHVGPKNYRSYMQIVRTLLKDDGLFLLHTIGSARTHAAVDPWIHRYIFPNGHIPSNAQIAHAADALFVLEDYHNFGADYAWTLKEWHKNFKAAWSRLSRGNSKYTDRFFRMWEFYLLGCSGAFEAREMQLYQYVFSKKGVPGGYGPVR